MKRLIAFAASAAFVLVASGHSVAPTLCQGIANNGMSYGAFIDKFALSEELASQYTDPVLREQIRTERASFWKGQVKSGQLSICGSTTL